MWCMWPIENNGSVIIYRCLVRPFILKHEKEIDAALNRASGGFIYIFRCISLYTGLFALLESLLQAHIKFICFTKDT